MKHVLTVLYALACLLVLLICLPMPHGGSRD